VKHIRRPARGALDDATYVSFCRPAGAMEVRRLAIAHASDTANVTRAGATYAKPDASDAVRVEGTALTLPPLPFPDALHAHYAWWAATLRVEFFPACRASARSVCAMTRTIYSVLTLFVGRYGALSLPNYIPSRDRWSYTFFFTSSECSRRFIQLDPPTERES
jgi:hypothetical protein